MGRWSRRAIGRALLGSALGSVGFLVACTGAGSPANQTAAGASSQRALRLLASESFIADIAQNVAGDRADIDVLVPVGVDPHAFDPTPVDGVRVAQADVLIVNGAGLEGFLEKLLQQAGGRARLIEAAAGLPPRQPAPDEAQADEAGHEHETDPHFWLDPIAVVRYVENIQAGLAAADPAWAGAYAANAAAYAVKLRALDAWAKEQVNTVPPGRRLLVTNHESFGYFADRYGLRVVGTVLPGTGTGSAPSARQMADLVVRIRATGAPAVFLETGSSQQLAQAIASEANVKVVTDLRTHSLTDATGVAPTYLDMMRHNVRTVVDALR